MFVANTGAMAAQFNEEGVNSSGSLTSSLQQPSDLTGARVKAENSMIGLAKSSNTPLGIIVAKVLSQSVPELQSYVQARGESPNPNPSKLALQAALLRATEIGLVAKSLDTTDENALLTIEDSEQQHVEDNTGENASILSPDTAAAICLLVYRLSYTFRNNGGSGNMADFVNQIKVTTNADSFDNVSYSYVVDKMGQPSFGKPSNATGDILFYTPQEEQAVTGGTTTVSDAPGSNADTSTVAQGSGLSFWDNLFNNMDSIVNDVTKASTAVNTTLGNVNTTTSSITDKINQIGGGIGSASISQYMQKNGTTVIAVILALIIVTIIAIRVSHRN